MTVYESVSDLIGGTPLVELTNYEKNHDLRARIVGKVESFNPAGSIKDRIAKAMIDDALARGLIDGDTVLIEPTSGNTGVGLAAIAAARGMRLIIAMPETMSVERRNLMKAYGAELVLTDGALGMKGALRSWRPRSPPRSSSGSSRTRRTRPSTRPPRAPRYGRPPAATWIFSWRAWARAAR